MRSFQGAPSPPAAASSQSLLSASDDLVFFPCPPCAWAVRGREIDFPLPPESGFEFSGPPRYSDLRDAPHEAIPRKSRREHQQPKERTGRREGRESIDALTPALDDDCIIAAYLRLCPPTCPTATSKEKTQHCP